MEGTDVVAVDDEPLTRGPIRRGPMDRPRAPRVRNGLWGVLVAGVVGAAVPQTWFRPGRFIAEGSTGPPLLGLRGITHVWSAVATGTGSTWFPSNELLPRAITSLVHTFGGSASTAQRLWFTLVVSVCAAAVAWCAHAFVRRPAAVGAAGAVAVLNPFHLATLPDLAPMIAIGSAALLVGTAARLLQGRHVPAAVGVLIAVWAAPLAEDPEFLLVLAVVALGCLGAVLVRGPRPAALRVVATFLVGSVFWSLPLTLHLATGTPGLRVVGDTGPHLWRWSQAHSGLRNILTLVANPAWGNRDLLGSVARLARFPWSLLRWAIPVTVLLTAMFSWRRRSTRVLVSIGAATVVVCMIGDAVPGGAMLVLCVALLIGIGIDDGLQRWEQRGEEFDAAQSLPVLLALCVVSIVFVHPLITGTVVPGARAYLPSARVAVPHSWLDAGSAIDALPGEGATLVLPLSDRVNRGTVWGFYGVDDLLRRVSGRPSVFVLPGAYYAPDGSSPDLMHTAETSLAHGDRNAFIGAMNALGAGYLAIRTDVTTGYGRNHVFTDWHALVSAAARLGLRSVGSFQYVRVFAVSDAGRFDVGARTVVVDAVGGTKAAQAAALAAPLLGAGVTIADRRTAVSAGSGFAWAPRADETGYASEIAAGTYRVGVVPLGPALWRASTSGNVVSLDPADRAEVDGRSLLVRGGLRWVAGHTPYALLVRSPDDPTGGGEVVSLASDSVVQAGAGATVTVLTAEAARLDFSGVAVGDCSTEGLPAAATPGMHATSTINGVDLVASLDTACVALPAGEPPVIGGHRRWRLTADYQSSAPGAVHTCLWLVASGRCADGSRVATVDRQGTIDEVVDAFSDDLTGAKLMLAADHVGVDGEPPTVVHLSNVRLAPIVADGAPQSFPSAAADPQVVRVDAADTGISLSAGNSVGNLVGRFDLPGDDCNRYDDVPSNVSATNLRGEPAPAMTLSADRHTACVSAPVAVTRGIRDITVTFAYRAPDNGVARVALVDSATGRAVFAERLAATSFWADHELRFTVPPAPQGSADEYRLYFYADGPGPGADRHQVHADFRSIRTSPSTSFAMAVVPDTGGPATSTVRDLSGGYVALHATGDAVLVHRQAYAPGWQLDGLPAGAVAEHFVADGWSNGWVIHGLDGRSVVLRVRYRDDPIAALAVWSLPLVLVLALLCTDWRRLRS